MESSRVLVHIVISLFLFGYLAYLQFCNTRGRFNFQFKIHQKITFDAFYTMYISLPATDEETLSVALGYTCHLVSMIAQFLDLPLRYPMNSRGSRSTLMDFAIEKVGEKDRQ